LIAEEAASGVNDKTRRLIDNCRACLPPYSLRMLTAAQKCFPALCKELKRRPLLYVPFENGGQPAAILKARMLQSVIRVLLEPVAAAGHAGGNVRTAANVLCRWNVHCAHQGRPSPNSIACSALGSAARSSAFCSPLSRWKIRGQVRRVQAVAETNSKTYWTLIPTCGHGTAARCDCRLSKTCMTTNSHLKSKEFIETYGDDLFHTRMLTLGNARAILHHGAETMFDELQETVALTQNVKLLEDFESGEIDREDAAELAEFVYECVVDNFDRFLEYNTTTTHSDYGNRLYCLLDFLRLEALYDRFEWNTIPWQVAHEAMVRGGDLELAAGVEEFVNDESRSIAILSWKNSNSWKPNTASACQHSMIMSANASLVHWLKIEWPRWCHVRVQELRG
jgi:hypothetical protein